MQTGVSGSSVASSVDTSVARQQGSLRVSLERAAWPFLLSVPVLLLGELPWLAYSVLSAGAVGLLVAASISVMASLLLFGLALVHLLERYASKYVDHGMVLFTAPLAAWISTSALSGERASELPGINLAKVALTLVLLAAVFVGLRLLRWASVTGRHRRLAAMVAVMFVGSVAAAFLDYHLLVGLYPSLHYSFMLGALYGAGFVGLGVSRRWARPRFASLASAGLVALACVLVSLTAARSAAAVRLATYSEGLYPKARRAVRLGTGWLTPARRAESQHWEAADFEFTPTHTGAVDGIRAATKNVVFILTDAFRGDHVDHVHEGRALMPFTQSWLAQPNVVRFTRAYSPSDRTARSMGPLFVSYPTAVVDETAELGLQLSTWINELRQHGFRSYANGNCHYLQRRHDDIRIDWCMGAEEYSGTRTMKSYSKLISQLEKFLETVGQDEPFVLYTHWMDAHVSGTKGIKGRYRDAVESVDRRLKQLVELLEETGRYDETMIVWTADHGYALGERGQYRGKRGVREYMTRVPLVMHIPKLGSEGATIPVNVSGLSVTATILDVLAPDTQRAVGEPSLLGLLVDPADPRLGNRQRVLVTSGKQHAVHRGSFKLMVNDESGTSSLFDVQHDPDENSPIENPELSSDLENWLEIEMGRQRALLRTLEQQLPRVSKAAAVSEE